MVKFSQSFGKVEVINQTGQLTTIKVFSTGEEKKLMTAYANLQDEPFEKAVKVKSSASKPLTKEEELLLSAKPNLLRNTIVNSKNNVRAGKAGSSSLKK